MIWDLGFRIYVLSFTILDLGIRVWDLRFRGFRELGGGTRGGLGSTYNPRFRSS